VDLTKASTKAVAASSSGNSKNNPFVLPVMHSKALTLRRGKRTEGFKGRGQSDDGVKVHKPKDKYGDFSTVICLYAVPVVVKFFRGLDLIVDRFRQAVICQGN